MTVFEPRSRLRNADEDILSPSSANSPAPSELLEFNLNQQLHQRHLHRILFIKVVSLVEVLEL